ncbi:MAG: hypothetical protein AAGJ35_14015 [Myxococcota bacterium]
MARIVEFELRHSLREEEAIDAMFDMLNEFEDGDDFDELDWDDDQHMAFFANEALEVEIYVGPRHLEVYAEIYNADYSERDFERDIREDLVAFFDVEEDRGRGGRRVREDRPRRDRGPGAVRVREERAESMAQDREEAHAETGNALPFRRRRSSGRARRMVREDSTKRRARREQRASQDRMDVVASRGRVRDDREDQVVSAQETSSGGFSWFWFLVIVGILGAAGYVVFAMLN